MSRILNSSTNFQSQKGSIYAQLYPPNVNALPVGDRLHPGPAYQGPFRATPKAPPSAATTPWRPRACAAPHLSAPMAPSYGINTGLLLPGVEFGVFLYAGRTQDGDTTPDCKCPTVPILVVLGLSGSEVRCHVRRLLSMLSLHGAVSDKCKPQNVIIGELSAEGLWWVSCSQVPRLT